MAAARRLGKELEKMRADPFPGLLNIQPAPSVWIVTFAGAAGTLYAGETFHLSFTFDSDYPVGFCGQHQRQQGRSLFLTVAATVLPSDIRPGGRLSRSGP
jgi:hypothetical protein